VAGEVLKSPLSPSQGLNISKTLGEAISMKLGGFLKSRAQAAEIAAGSGTPFKSASLSKETTEQLQATDEMFERLGNKEPGIYKRQ
jgi:hypothetical protein